MSRMIRLSIISMIIFSLLLASCAPKPADQLADPGTSDDVSQTVADPDWANKPMAQRTTVVLSVESGAQEKTLNSFRDEILEKLNIELKVVAHPFSEQYEIQFLDLSSGSGQFDVLSFWPIYTADFAPFLSQLKDIPSGGADQVWKDLQMDDVHPAYLWAYNYKGDIYATQYDGDVKLLNYRYDLANDPQEKAAFKAKYGYDFDINKLTWEQYYDMAEFFTRPEQNFFGTAEIAGFLAYFTFADRYMGMGGHFFSYEDMTPFPNMDVCVKAVQHGIDTFSKVSPPEARSFEFEDARNQIIKENRVFFMVQWPDVWAWTGDPSLSNAEGKVAVAVMPGFERDGKLIQRPEMNGGRVLAVNKASKSQEAAYKVLVFFSDAERTSQLVNNNDTWLDPWRSSHLRPELWSHLCTTDPKLCQIYVDVIDQATALGYPGLQIRGTGRYHEVVERWSKKAWAGQSTAVETCDGMAKEFGDVTKQLGFDSQLAEWRRYVDEVLKPANLWP
jgi:multiple sugar transport system substrate-binding protein